MRLLVIGLLALLPLLAQAAEATRREKLEGFSLSLPADWEVQRGVMGLPLMARPPKASDPQGWGSDLLTVTVEKEDLRRTCLEGFTQRKLGQISFHAAAFQKLEEEPLTLGGAVATRLTLRYTEGPRELMAYVLVMQSGARFVTLTLLSSPQRFEFQRAAFRRIAESLRPR